MDDSFVSLVACPQCGATDFSQDRETIWCNDNQHRFRKRPYADMLVRETEVHAQSLEQYLMESPLLARAYETWWRPWFVRMVGGKAARDYGGGFAGEYFIHKQSLGLEYSEGPWLDLSCGPGLFTRAMAATCPGELVVGVDISKAMLETAASRVEAYENVQLVRCDAHDLPFQDGSFAGVNNASALHAYQTPEQVFQEVWRCLVPGGVYVGSTFRQSKHVAGRGVARLVGVRTFRERELPTWLSRVGFRDYEQVLVGDVIVFRVKKP